jgi:hypothetical protein
MRVKLTGFMRVVAAVLLPVVVARAGALPLAPQVGDTYEITQTRDSARGGSGSSGSSQDKDTIIERVTGLRADGLELLYDLPDAATADERAGNWQFPARVDGWLKAAGWSRSVCGHWIFTWTAIRIECDPQSVIKVVQSHVLARLRHLSHLALPVAPSETSAVSLGARCVIAISAFLANA